MPDETTVEGFREGELAHCLERLEADPRLRSDRETIEAEMLDMGFTYVPGILAFREIPREDFVPEPLKPYAYYDTPLPIGFDQTISQPSLVLGMLSMLGATEENTVLDIGTGSGYGAALLSKVARQVYSTEVVPELAERARGTLRDLTLENVAILTVEQGTVGWQRQTPYDRIIVGATAPCIPNDLLDQLAVGGRMVIPTVLDSRDAQRPYGSPHTGERVAQTLNLVTKSEEGILIQQVARCDFVPLRYAGFVEQPE